MENIIVIAIVAAILSLAMYFIYREKKAGKRCIGCPDSGTCGGCSGNCSCCSGNCGSADK